MATESNNGLYFVVGALVVAVMVIGTIFIIDTDATNGPGVIERTERTIERTTDGESSSSFSLDIDEDGVTATQTEEN